MSQASTGLSRHERKRSGKLVSLSRAARNDDITALLVDRQQASRMLNVSIPTLMRMEDRGELTPVRLNKKKNSPGKPHSTAKVYYRVAQVRALAGADADR